MTNQEFLTELRDAVSGLPKKDIEENIDFYSEIIDDRIEEGKKEEDVISEIGAVKDIATQIIADTPLVKIAKEKIKPQKKFKVWEILLLALGSPIWLSLAVAAAAVILALYVVLWAMLVSLWAVFVSLAACAACGVVIGIVFTLIARGLTGIAMLGAGLVCAGLAIFMFFGCLETSKGIIILTKRIALGIKKCFVKKEV